MKPQYFGVKKGNVWNSNQLINCKSQVLNISLSSQEDKLIAFVQNQQILVIMKQIIYTEQYGQCTFCFINQDQFVLQLFDRQQIFIIDYYHQDQTFKQGQELQYSNKVSDSACLFPIYYFSQIDLIMVKNDYDVHLIKKSQNGQFTLEQTLNFGSNELFCGVSDDGRYIVTWNYESFKIKIRKFEY